MKSLARNFTTYYYALYEGKSRVMDEDGNYTGEWDISFSDVVKVRDTISAARGNAEDDIFGVNLDYQRQIVTTANRPIDEYSAIWICGTLSAITEEAHSVGDLGIYNGKIYKCITANEETFNADYWELYPQTHKVVAVAKSINSTVYAIKEVDINA